MFKRALIKLAKIFDEQVRLGIMSKELSLASKLEAY